MKQLVFFSLPALILGLAGCSMVSKLPVVGDGDDGGARDVKAPADAAPYTSDRPLGAGDVLDIAVFKGIRSGREVYEDVARVGTGGTLDLGKFGQPLEGSELGHRQKGTKNQIDTDDQQSAS